MKRITLEEFFEIDGPGRPCIITTTEELLDMARNNTWEITFTRTVIEIATTIITADSEVKAKELSQQIANLMNGGLRVSDKGDNEISFHEGSKKYSEITVESAKQKW